jgi:two-component system, OmpR family, phosphate regulon sensor histidine kinase PhoR
VRRPVSAQLRLAIGALLALLLAILAAAFWVPYELNANTNDRYVEDVIPLRGLVHDLSVQLVEQEAAVRGYIITGDQRDLVRYDNAFNAVNRDLAAMRPYFARHPTIEQLVRRALGQIADLEGHFQQQIALAARSQEGRQEAQSRIAEGEEPFERFRDTVMLMLAETDRFVAEAEDDQAAIYERLLVVLAALGTIALAIGLLLFFRMPRRLGELYAAELRSRREAESRADAARALEHVQDGVVLTDAAGRVRFLNPAAAALAGSRQPQTLGEVLPGIDELATREHDAAGPFILPIETPGGERWLSVTGVDFGDGRVYALRDITEERAVESLRAEFVATASHELRTPLTAVYGAARTLLRRDIDLSGPRRRDFLEMIAAESERLSRIVDDILLANRLDAGAVDIATERCDPYALASSVVDAARARAPSNIEVRLDAAPELPPIAADPDRLRQVLVNILDNAIKYSPDGGEVALALRGNGERLRFEVRDEGLGFPASERERVFQRFHRLDPQQRRGIGGTGLGLYISRELIERMDGRIWAESEPGQGAAFFVELPLAR